MSNNSLYIGIVFLIAYLFLTISTQIKISKSNYFNKSQKTANSILIWLIPFIWALLIKSFLKPNDTGTMTKDKRKINKNKYYESENGFIE